MFCAPSKLRQRAKLWIMGILKTSDHIQTRSRCQTPVRNLQRPVKPQIRTLRTRMIFAPSKLRQRAKIWIIGVSQTSDQIHVQAKIPNHSQEPLALGKHLGQIFGPVFWPEISDFFQSSLEPIFRTTLIKILENLLKPCNCCTELNQAKAELI